MGQRKDLAVEERAGQILSFRVKKKGENEREQAFLSIQN